MPSRSWSFRRHSHRAGWRNTRLSRGRSGFRNGEAEKPGREEYLHFGGSAHLARELVPNGLVDEFQIIVNPIILGSGTTAVPEYSHADRPAPGRAA